MFLNQKQSYQKWKAWTLGNSLVTFKKILLLELMQCYLLSHIFLVIFLKS